MGPKILAQSLPLLVCAGTACSWAPPAPGHPLQLGRDRWLWPQADPGSREAPCTRPTLVPSAHLAGQGSVGTTPELHAKDWWALSVGRSLKFYRVLMARMLHPQLPSGAFSGPSSCAHCALPMASALCQAHRQCPLFCEDPQRTFWLYFCIKKGEAACGAVVGGGQLPMATLGRLLHQRHPLAPAGALSHHTTRLCVEHMQTRVHTRDGVHARIHTHGVHAHMEYTCIPMHTHTSGECAGCPRGVPLGSAGQQSPWSGSRERGADLWGDNTESEAALGTHCTS